MKLKDNMISLEGKQQGRKAEKIAMPSEWVSKQAGKFSSAAAQQKVGASENQSEGPESGKHAQAFGRYPETEKVTLFELEFRQAVEQSCVAEALCKQLSVQYFSYKMQPLLGMLAYMCNPITWRQKKDIKLETSLVSIVSCSLTRATGICLKKQNQDTQDGSACTGACH